MSYDVGTHFDLSHIGKKVASVTPRKSLFEEAISNAYEVGTQFIFTNGKAARRIPVVFVS